MKYIYSVLVVAVSFAIISCENKPDLPSMHTNVADTYSQVVDDTLPAPIVINLSDFEPPEVIKAADPIYDSLSTPFGRGIPDITRYTTQDGLPQSIIRRVLQGPDGLMWFLFVETLSKFDGKSFTTYNRFNGLMEETYSVDFLLDGQDRIWIATTDGVTVFDGRSFTTYTLDKDGNKLGVIESIVEDNDGTLWLGSRGNGLFQFQNDQITRVAVMDHQILQLLIDKEGHVVIRSNNNQVFVYDGTEFTSYDKIPENNVPVSRLSLFADSMKNFWFYTGNGRIGKYDGSEITYYEIGEMDTNDRITDLAEDSKGNIWLSTTNGLSYFDGSVFANYSNADLGISDNIISSIAFDREGSLWVIYQSGVMKINPTLSFPEVPGEPNLVSIIPDPSGDVWIATDKGFGKYEEDKLAWYAHELASDPNYGSSSSQIFDYEGQLWFLVADEQIEGLKLIKFDGTYFTIYGPEQGFNKEMSSECFIIESIDRNTNALRINCRDKVLEFDGERIIQQNFLPDVRLSSYLVGNNGNLWFGTEEHGIYTYDGKQLSQFSTNTGLVSNRIIRIAEDQSGNIWATIDYGNVRITDTTVSAFNALDGLANLMAGITPDTVNNVLWFGSISGLVSLDSSQFNEEKPRFRRYNTLTGFSIGPVRTPFYDANGRVWGSSLPTGSIFQLDYPALIELPAAKPYIKNIQLNNQPVSWLSLTPFQNEKDSMAVINEMGLKFGERLSNEQLLSHFHSFGEASFDSVNAPHFIPVNLSLPFKNNSIRFEFSTISPTYGAATQYQYRLEGSDDNWSKLSDKTEASFGNLPEGSYTFVLKALNVNGDWSEISYPFVIRPPWQRTWWAYLLYLMVLGGAVSGFIFWRTNSLKRDRHRLENEVTNRTAELQQSNLQLEESLSELKAAQTQLIQQEKLASLGQLTAGIAHEIKNPLNFVNNFSDVSLEMIDEALEELQQIGENEHAAETAAILADIKSNLTKIHEHGSRANGIVQSMLMHSRGGSGKMEPTNLNALIKEYVNLSFHGMRAGKEAINVDMELQLDESVGEVPLIAEDFSRVILNLCNNAFDAMRDKQGSGHKAQGAGGPGTSIESPFEGGAGVPDGTEVGDDTELGYAPKLTVRTKSSANTVTIEIEDNGPGIPEDIKDKILQPFFTTKKGTQGTGLGLSITNDIVKAHGGSMEIYSQPGQTTFTIKLTG